MEMVAGFVGYECEDMVIYLARMFSALGKRTMILDLTEQGSVIGICGEVQEYAGISFSSCPAQGMEQDSDVILKVFGYQPRQEDLKECRKLFLVTDGSAFRARLLSKFTLWQGECCLIVRNMVSMRYGEAYLALLSEHQIERCFTVFADERDVKERCCLGMEKRRPLHRLSESMRELLRELVQYLDASVEERQLRLAQKKA
ncbi:MAG: hypothetical protein ACI4FZ_10500 [Lachnospiraceae bacterium]